MTTEPESLILQILRQMRAETVTKTDLEALRADLRAELASKDELRSEMHSLRADVASEILSTRKELSEQIVGLRRAVIEYHTSVIGQGVLDQRARSAHAPRRAASQPALALSRRERRFRYVAALLAAP
jgi:hypothetical protein